MKFPFNTSGTRSTTTTTTNTTTIVNNPNTVRMSIDQPISDLDRREMIGLDDVEDIHSALIFENIPRRRFSFQK